MRKPSPQFLDIKNYRRKRWVDASRLLLVVGITGVVLPIPFLFQSSEPGAPAVPLAIYFFGFWLVLIASAFVVAGKLVRPEGHTGSGVSDLEKTEQYQRHND